MTLTRRTMLATTLGSAMLPWASRAMADVPVTIAVSSNSLAYGGVHIAVNAGLFEKQGLALKIVTMDSGSAATTGLLSGSVAFASAAPSEVMAARLHGQNIVLVSNIYRGQSGSLVLAKSVADKLGAAATASPDAKLKALDGLVIASPSATSSYTLSYKAAAQAAGAQIHFTYMAQPAMLAAIQTGAIQGMVAGAPFSVTAVNNGAAVMWISGPRGELPDNVVPRSAACIDTTEAYAAAHPDVVSKIQAAFADLATYLRDKPDEALKHLAEAYPQVDPAILKTVFTDEWKNWAQPVMTADDVRHEITLQVASGSLKGVESVAPDSLLVKTK
jgi:ABC-type nitrate/sulfonate/bicarbonate transport system substrate-binding protein